MRCAIDGNTPQQQVGRPGLQDQDADRPRIALGDPHLHVAQDARVVGQQRQRLDAEALVSHSFPLERIQEAFATQADAARSLKVTVSPGG